MKKSELRKLIQEAIGMAVEPGRCRDEAGLTEGCGGHCRYPAWKCKDGCTCDKGGKGKVQNKRDQKRN